MWTCPKCNRIFAKTAQMHSCRNVPLDEHFKNKENAKDLFDYLLQKIENEIGHCQIISLPCCIHLFSSYDFLAALPKKDRLEIRFSLNRKIDDSRLVACVPISSTKSKNCFDIHNKKDIDTELMSWIKESSLLPLC